MASEPRRGCGYRKVGALYLCGEYFSAPCDRLPLELKSCPVCGGGIHFNRGVTKVNPLKLFGVHDGNLVGLVDDQPLTAICRDKYRPCHVCDPPDAVAFIMTVGKRYYSPASFLEEARTQGISKRIPTIPKDLALGETVVYLAHPEAVEGVLPPGGQGELIENSQARLLDAEKPVKKLGIFCAFIPQRVEMPVWESELTDEKRAELEKRGITPISIKDGDEHHV